MAFDKNEFYRAFGDYVGVPSDVTITAISDETFYGGYCETCSYEEQRAVVEGKNADGTPYRESFYMSLSEFVNSL